MLVLTRKKTEAILIGGNILVQVVAIEGGKVRLGITAPREVPVVRTEIIGEAAPVPPGSPLSDFRSRRAA